MKSKLIRFNSWPLVVSVLVILLVLLGEVLLGTPVITAQSAAVYEQLPGHFGGFFSDGQVLTVADEFQLDQPTPVQNITWWGGYGSVPLGDLPSDNFTIRIFADNMGQPGVLVATFDVANNALRAATGDFVNPPDSEFEGRPEFKYSFDLPEDLTVAANTRYWLSIVNVPSSDIWVWEVSDSSINLGVQRSFSDPVSGPWMPYFDNTAFQIQGAQGATIDSLIDAVQKLVDDGILNDGEGTSLTSKLDNANNNLAMENITAATNELNAFINEVQALINSERLTVDQGQSLIDTAQAIIDTLSN